MELIMGAVISILSGAIAAVVTMAFIRRRQLSQPPDVTAAQIDALEERVGHELAGESKSDALKELCEARLAMIQAVHVRHQSTRYWVALVAPLSAQIPVTDVAHIAVTTINTESNVLTQIGQITQIANELQQIAHLVTQIEHMLTNLEISDLWM